MAFPSTFVDIQNAVIANLRLDSTADLQKTKDAINAAYSDVAVRSKYFEGSTATTALVAGATSDALPAALIELEDVTCAYAGITPPLTQVTWEHLLSLRTNTSTGPPRYYSLRKATLEFWPSAIGSEVLTYYGSKQPAAWLSADADVPDLPEPFSTNLLTYGACVKMAEFQQDLLVLGDFGQQYEQAMTRFMAFCQMRLGLGSLAFRILPGAPIEYPHDPGSDWYVYAGMA